MQPFPRVLFITPVAFNPYTGGGATFTSLFTGWPKEALATVHDDPDPVINDFCTHYYKLGTDELDFVEPFGWLRRRKRGTDSAAAGTGAPSAPSAKPSMLQTAQRILLADSVPQRATLTPALRRWIADYKPDVIYTILGSNGMMALIEDIRAAFDLPLVVHIMDDWATSAHRSGLFAPLERYKMNRWLAHFFKTANACLAISPAMEQAYTARYGRPFPAFQFTLDVQRWSQIRKTDLTPRQPPEFLYVGSIFAEAQLQSLTDCAQAIAELNADGFPARLRIITQARTIARFQHQLALHPNIRMTPSDLDDDAFFGTLAAADALLLPVNFDRQSVDLMRYSMPTKVPSYLVSGTPCLVYGSDETAQVRYAQDSGWGLVIAKRSMAALKAGLRQVVEDMSTRRALAAAAAKTAANHDANIVRPAFQDVLRHAAGHHRSDR